MLTRCPRADQDVTPPEEFTQNFSKQRIAEVYLEEADDYEKAAYKLREQAKEICGEAVLHLNGGDTPTHRPARQATRKAEKNGPCTPQIKAIPEREAGEKTLVQLNIETKDPTTVERSKETEGAAPIVTPIPVNELWIPLAIRQMPPTQPVPVQNPETFAFDLLKSELGGQEWSPGFYFIKTSTSTSAPKLPIRSYWILESEFEPFLPNEPGHHGAKLTAFFNETVGLGEGQAPTEDDYDNVPVFICNKAVGTKKGEYRYFGHYRQTRYSDKVDMDHLLSDIPEKVRRYHAEQLADTGRPAWVTEALKQHFWPRDEYFGPVPTDSAINTPKSEAAATDCSGVVEKRVLDSLMDYANDLKEREKEANLKVSLLTADSLMQAFSKADADEEPGLRLNLEYFQFLQYEQGFYDYLVQLKENPKIYERAVVEAVKAPLVKKPAGVGGKMVKAAGGVETLHPARALNKVRLSDKSAIPTEESKLKWVEGKTESPKTVVNTATKNNSGASKPWEKKEEEYKTSIRGAREGPTIVNGNLEAAKVLQKEFKSGSGKEKGKGGGSGGGEKGRPPHLQKK